MTIKCEVLSTNRYFRGLNPDGEWIKDMDREVVVQAGEQKTLYVAGWRLEVADFKRGKGGSHGEINVFSVGRGYDHPSTRFSGSGLNAVSTNSRDAFRIENVLEVKRNGTFTANLVDFDGIRTELEFTHADDGVSKTEQLA